MCGGHLCVGASLVLRISAYPFQLVLHHTHSRHVVAFGVTVPRVCLTQLLKSRISRHYHVCHLLQYDSRRNLNFVSKSRVDGRLRIETQRLKYKTTTSLALVLAMHYGVKDS